MEIIAHRGFIDGPVTSTRDQLSVAMAHGFGVEFDVRDSDSGIVLAHDPWETNAPSFGEFLGVVPEAGTLAVNIKSCGLAVRIKEELRAYGVDPARCFFFDMAVPDHVSYVKNGLRAYPRISEIEPWGALAESADGVWLDGFHSAWWDVAAVSGWLKKGAKVCVVSPELHRRDRHEAWSRLRQSGLHFNPSLSICTDYALEAREYFRG